MLPYYEKHQVTISMRGLRPNFRFPGHLHIQCELIWVKKGKMPMICENKEYEIGEGEVFIIFPNQIHAYLGSSEDVEGYILMFHPEEAAELRGSRAVRPTALAALTEREYEIVRLMSQRLTNRELAEKLFLSEGSVKQYINQIYSKLHIEGDARSKRKRLLELLSPKT